MLKKQKLVAVFLVFSLIIGILPVSVLAADTTGSFEATGGMVYYEIDDASQTVTITGCDTTVTAIEIPNSLEKLPVTKIADSAFSNMSGYVKPHDSLTSVKLPSTLTSIGARAFYDCTNLSNADLAACTGLKTIGDEAFYDCTNLSNADLAACTGLKTIGDRAFCGTALADVKFPASLSDIGKYAFATCKLTNVDLSGCTQLRSVSDGSFYINEGLISVKLPSTLISIGANAFDNCTGLLNVDLSACTELATIGSYAFRNSALTAVEFPTSLVDVSGFTDCKLTNVDLSGCTQLRSIGEDAFYKNKELVAVKLPSNVEIIDKDAFMSCEKLADVNFTACTSLKTIGVNAFCWTGLTSVTLPSSVSSLGVGAFAQCFQLKNADLSACTGLTVIEGSMFSECKALTSVKLPTSVTVINNKAFWACTSLSGMDLSSCLNLTRIEEMAFYGDSSLSDLKLSKALVSIGNEAFSYCTALSSLDLSVCTSLSEIGESAFNQISVTSLSFPSSLETIGRYAFNDCSSLTSVSWPNDSKLTTLTGFSGCTSLPVSVYNEGVSLPNVSAIGDAAFTNCGFESVTIPSNIREIGYYAFSTDSYEYENKLKELTIMAGVETIGKSAFEGCPITGTLNIPETVREIKYAAFAGTKITGLNIADGVEVIGESAFNDCVELEGSTIVVPESVALVGCEAFYGVTKPLTVVFRNRNIQLQEAPNAGQLTVGDKEYYSPFNNDYGSTNIIIKAYEKNSNGEASMMKLLYDALINDPDKDPDAIYKFIAISDRTVKVSGSIQSKAKVEICIDGQSVPVEISSGKFSVIADEGSTVTVKATANGYYDKNFIKADINEDWELGEIAFGESDKVPANNLMRIDFGDIAVSEGDKLTFTLKGGGETLKQGKDYTVQYPYIVLNDSVTAQRLTLSVNADELLYSANTVTALRESGVFNVTLTPWGKINVATTGDFAGDNNILVFDANENAVAQGVVNKNGILITDSLKAGTYKVIAFNANDSFSAISTVSTLEAMGLKKGTDYAEETVKVTDGKTAELTLNVPLLKTVTSNILNKNNCRLVAEQSRTVAGRACRTRVFYSFAGGKNGTVTVALPKGASVQTLYTQKEVLQKGVDYVTKGNTVTVNVKDSEGMFYITNIFSGVGEQSITAFGTVGNVSAPIGSATVAVEGMYLVPESQILTVSKNNKATVTSAPNSKVELWLDNDVVAWGTTNGNGNAVLTYNLPEVVLAGQEFKLKAVCGEFSAETTVSFSSKPKNTGLETWYFYNGSSYKQFLYSSSSTDDVYPSYTVNNHNSNVNFVATLISEAAPTNVITYAVMTDGNVEYVPMTLISSEAISSGAYQTHYKRYTFAGSLNKVLMATDFAIDWDEDTEYFTYNAKTVEAVNSKCNEVMTTRREQIETARESYVDKLEGIVPNVDDASKYIFGGKYHMSETEWFKGLSDTEQTAAYGLEKAIDKNISQLSKNLGLKKDLTQYKNWDEVYNEIGITQSKNTRTVEELQAAGFTICETANGFTAYRDDTEEKAAPVRMLRAAVSGAEVLARGGGAGGVTGGFTFIDESGNQVDFQAGALDNIKQSIRNDYISELTECYDDFAQVAIKNPACGTVEAGVLNSVSGGLQGVNTLIGIDGVRQDAEAMVDFTVKASEMDGYIQELELFENRYSDMPLCANDIMRERHIAQKIHLLLDNEAFRFGANSIAGSAFIVGGIFDKTGSTDVVGNIWDKATNTVGARRAAEIQSLLEDLDKQTRIRKQKCEKTDMEDIMRRTRKVARKNALMDPSGIIYEAVESNTLEGVTASVWYAEDENGTNAKMWDAENYDQINPQITDKNGSYAWDVTAGWWQVRFEKEGYESTQTRWMQVPPPRLGLKNAMVSKELPKVVSAKAYPDYIEVLFSQYMDTSKEISLPSGMVGTWKSIDSGYSKVLHITQAGGFKKGSAVSFTLDGAQNYAGKALPLYSSGKLIVTARPAEIILNYESIISMKVAEERRLSVRIKDADGNYMPNVTLEAAVGNADFARLAENTAVTDENGRAVFNMDTRLPGYTDITFTAAGTSLTKTVDLHITMDENRPQRPTAQIGTTQFTAESPKENYITVKNGEQLVISAEDGVTIYYTTDDTCPCQNSASRKTYTEPITITQNTKYRIAAYKDGMDYSERLNITVTVDDTHEHSYGSEWKSDANSHWHECSCGAVSDKADHNMKVENAKEATKTESGYTGDKICTVCGYMVKGKEIPPIGTTEPTEPTAPTAPTAPTVPTAPTEPTAPTAPTEPIAPTEPTEPIAPTEPTEPIAPTEPTEPAAPAKMGDNTPSASNGKTPANPNNGKQDVQNQDTNTNTSTTTTTPAKTGDSNNIFLWAAVLFVSGVGIFGTIFLKKKKYDE